MNKSSETIEATFDPKAAFDLELNPGPWQREAAQFREGLMTLPTPLLIPRELEFRGRPESDRRD